MEIKVEVKTDNTFICNVFAKCIVPFNSLFHILFNSILNFDYRYTLFFNRYIKAVRCHLPRLASEREVRFSLASASV